MNINSQSEQKHINNDITIHFPEGMIGFESLKNYKLLSSENEENLHWLQPQDDDSIEFAVTFPQVYQVEYELALSDEEEKLLQIETDDEIAVLVVLSRKSDTETDTPVLNANFLAPVVINTTRKLGMQKILSQQENPVTITMKG